MNRRNAFLILGMIAVAGCDLAPSKVTPTTNVPMQGASAPRASGSKTPLITTPAAPFELTDQDGQPFDSKSLRGKPWVGSFFFTQCPAVCWRMNQALAKWQTEHPDSAFKFVSITCDPEVDTPKALKLYADHFKADPKRWIFLTGKMDYITKVAQDTFLLAVQRATHSSRASVFDREGLLRGSFDMVDPEQYKKVETLMAEVEAEK